MNDVQQIILWETIRKAKEWYTKQPIETRAVWLLDNPKKSSESLDQYIVRLYENRP